MLSYVWPMALIITCNVIYQICAKSVAKGMNPFAALAITYSVGAIASLILYFILGKSGSLLAEFKQLNWAPIVLGLIVVGLEVGFIYAYKAGWPVSIAQIVQATILAIFLIFVGYGLYNEAITWNKVVGIAVCLAGFGLINLK